MEKGQTQMKKDRRNYALNEVHLKDEYCQNAFEKDVAYLLSLDADRLLAGFRENAGLNCKKMRYGGWENMLIGGHTLGHFLTAAAQGYANAQANAQTKEKLFHMIKYICDELLICQMHSLGKPGFIFGATILDKSNVELQFDFVEQNKTNIITEAWVPWYTMHKILDGLVNTYELTGYKPALTIADHLGDWVYDRVSTWSEETHKTVLSIEYGGMNDALYELYSCTKKEEHLIAAHAFDEISLFEIVAAKTKNGLNNHHANTTIPKFLGALNRYIVLGSGQEKYLEYVKIFWDTVIERHTYVTGGNSEWEHFGVDYILDAERTNCNNETCNTYNMLKMTRKLFQITGEKKYADYYENTLINAILSSQNPENGMTMYFQPMATGYFKVYGRPFDKFWCCTGSGMENFTKLNDSIYFKTEDGIITNLYFSSNVYDANLGITLKQDTDMLHNSKASFQVKCEKNNTFAKFMFRVPDWAFGYKVVVEGLPKQVVNEDGYLILAQTWNDGDQIDITFEKKVVAYGLPDCKNVYAFKYGQMLLSANLGTENMIDTMTGVDVTIPGNQLVQNEYLTVCLEAVDEFVKNIDEHFEKDLDKLIFTLKNVDQSLEFSPHYLKTRERYGIYWYLLDENQNAQDLIDKRAKDKSRKERIVDTVQPGYGQYENDTVHDMLDCGSVGSTEKGTTRFAKAGGSFAYHMRVKEGEKHQLELHLLAEDNGKSLQIRVGNDLVFSEVLSTNEQEEEYVIYVPVSWEYILNNLEERECGKTVLVCFEGIDGQDSARLSSFVYMMVEE